MKTAFMGAGSTVFVRNIIGDCMCVDALKDSEFVLSDIDAERLTESETIADTIGIGDIMRALRTIPARDMEEVCPDAWFLNCTKPSARSQARSLAMKNIYFTC